MAIIVNKSSARVLSFSLINRSILPEAITDWHWGEHPNRKRLAVEQGVSLHVTPIARILITYSFTNREMAVLILQERFSKYLPALKTSGEAEEMIRYGDSILDEDARRVC